MTPYFLSATLGAAMLASAWAGEPIKALLVTGGCCHNYEFQAKALTEGISKQASVEWTIVNEGGSATEAEIDLYKDPNWAKPYDIVVHNECFANTKDPEYIRSITEAHKAGTPAVVIHCAMHTYRSAEIDEWRQFLGVTSRHHEHQSRYPVKVIKPDHPAMKGFSRDWVTPMDELYVIEKVWEGATPLAVSVSERTGDEQPVVWVNEYGKGRVFGTTYGHSDATFRDPVFINLLAQGFLWAANADPTAGAQSKKEESDMKLRHIVAFKFKESSSKEDIQKVVDAFSELPKKIPQIAEYEWGINNSPEGLNKGFTHGFVVTFNSEEDRAAYLPHPAHKAFVGVLGPHLDDVFVIDFWAKEK